jgi:putative photosynthetic complex assembly protein
MTAMLHDDEIPHIGVPRPALIAAGLLILVTIVLAGAARLTGMGRTQLGTPGDGARVREIAFATAPADEIRIVDAASGAPIAVYEAGKGGFVRGSLRALRYERERRGLTLESAPYRLVEWRNGRLTLDDPATGYHVELNAFGAGNVEAYRALLH